MQNEKKTIKRSVNWDQEEKDLLSSLVMEKLETLENIKIDTNTNKRKREAWSSVTELFNKVSKNNRSVEQIQNQWRKTKYATKANNNAYIRQIKQTGGGPPPARLNSFDEELVSRLPKHFEHDFNIYDSNSLDVEFPESKSSDAAFTESKYEDNSLIEIFNSDDEKVSIQDTEKKTLKPKLRKSRNTEKLDENAMRIKLLDVSIQQKEMEMNYSKLEFDEKKKLLDLQILQIREDHNLKKQQNEMLEIQIEHLKEEHGLKIEKLKLEMHNLKKGGFFT